ncbi:hypothetical protein, partial [Pannonibacter tanglangensis]|uniref:hypothetical protein n=1 Tax=Pannonibacter tanglangensis TaxID=2750084 RepID=UPI001AD91C2E
MIALFSSMGSAVCASLIRINWLARGKRPLLPNLVRRAGVAALSAVYLVQSVALGLTPAQAQVSPPSSGQASGQ